MEHSGKMKHDENYINDLSEGLLDLKLSVEL